MISVQGPLQYLGFATFSSVQIFAFVYISTKYLKIRGIIAEHYKHMRQVTETGDTRRAANDINTERSHNLTLLMIISVFVIVWFPFMIILIIGTVYQAKGERPGKWLQNGFVWTAILTYVNGAVNPFIYSIRYKDIGDEMKRYFRKMRASLGFTTATVTDDSA